MKPVQIALFFALCLFSFNAQAQAHQTGDIFINAGIGLGTFTYGAVSLNSSIEYAITNEFSLGLALGYSGYNRNRYYSSSYPLKISVFYLGPRATYHFAELLDISNDQIDLYGGVFLGYGIVSARYRGERLSGYTGTSTFGYSVFGGMRYQFNPKVAAYGELGAGVSILQLGASFKL